MTHFEHDGVYNGIPYRVLPDCSIEAMMPGGSVRFRNMDELVATCGRTFSNTREMSLTDRQSRNVPTSAEPVDYYTILLEAINTTQQNSAQLRALVYERARFNLKREILFGYSLVGLADVAQQIQNFELAVARIEANAVNSLPTPAYRESDNPSENLQTRPANIVQILPPVPEPPLYAGLVRRNENWQYRRLFEEFVRHVRFTNKFIVGGIVGIAVIGIAVTMTIWFSRYVPSRSELASRSPRETAAKQPGSHDDAVAQAEESSKAPFPLPTSFGIFLLSENKLTELDQLPIAVPDARIALSAEIDKPSAIATSDQKPAFILFRRDLLNAAPQKIMLRVVARMTRETRIVDGKARTNNIEGAWRIRNISRELKISPVPGQREMLLARMEDDAPLDPGRYILVLNRVGYDFTVKGNSQAPAFCLEKFETTNGSVFNQCRAP